MGGPHGTCPHVGHLEGGMCAKVCGQGPRAPWKREPQFLVTLSLLKLWVGLLPFSPEKGLTHPAGEHLQEGGNSGISGDWSARGVSDLHGRDTVAFKGAWFRNGPRLEFI